MSSQLAKVLFADSFEPSFLELRNNQSREILLKINYPDNGFSIKLFSEINFAVLRKEKEVLKFEAYFFNSEDLNKKLQTVASFKKKVLVLQELLSYYQNIIWNKSDPLFRENNQKDRIEAECFIEWSIVEPLKDLFPAKEKIELLVTKEDINSSNFEAAFSHTLLAIIKAPEKLEILLELISELISDINKFIKIFDNYRQINSIISKNFNPRGIYHTWLGLGGNDQINLREHFIKETLYWYTKRALEKEESENIVNFKNNYVYMPKKSKNFNPTDYVHFLNGFMSSINVETKFQTGVSNNFDTKLFQNILSKGGYHYKIYSWTKNWKTNQIPSLKEMTDELIEQLIDKKAIPPDSLKSRIYVYEKINSKSLKQSSIHFDFLSDNLKEISSIPIKIEGLSEKPLLQALIPNPINFTKKDEDFLEEFDQQKQPKQCFEKANVKIYITFDWSDLKLDLTKEEMNKMKSNLWPQCFLPLRTETYFSNKNKLFIYHDQEEAEKMCLEYLSTNEKGAEVKLKIMLKLRYDKKWLKNNEITSRSGYFVQAIMYKKV